MVEHHKPLFIYHHLGLGDHIICNAIVRNIRKKFTNKLFLFCKPQYFTSVSFMYRDIDITIVPFDDVDVINFFKDIPLDQQIIIGHQYLNVSGGLSFDEAFYKQIGLSFDKRWNDFYVERDSNKEERVLNIIKPPYDGYVFIHEDKNRNFIIDRTHITPNLGIVTPQDGLTDNIFDYLKVIQHAKEIHCIDSCFKLMIDSVFNNTLKSKLVFHFNLKNNVIKDRTVSKHKLNWLVV
jgi:hypothetical protein